MTRPEDTHRYRVTHQPSGDEAEADTREAAALAAKTLLNDNGGEGTCRVWEGQYVVDVVWSNGDDSVTHVQ